MSKSSHIALNIIVSLDFDGCIAIGEDAKVKWAKIYHGIDVKPNEITKKTYPLKEGKYKELMQKVTIDHIMDYKLDPQCKDVLDSLYKEGFRFAVVTSRSGPELYAAIRFLSTFKLPIAYFHAVDNKPKDVICTKLRARAMIDDSLDKLVELVNTPLQLFFLRRTWNEEEKVTGELKQQVKVIKDWREFHAGLLELRDLHEAVCYYNDWENNFAQVKKITDFIKQNSGKASQMLKDYRKFAT